MLPTLTPLAESLAERLKARKQTVAVAESSSGGLISAALLAVPGASAYFLGGAVVYTGKARMSLMHITRETVAGIRSSSEPYALLLARTARENFGSDWGLSETGAAGPTGNPYGDAAGHTCVAVSGPVEMAFTLETADADRAANMEAFAKAALELLSSAMGEG
ncbi:MAG TPA: CinA family protein [Caulobacteraceae bacterium]|jgi:PncC family amidohydrolase|nr:CinA family protein [Caulobacteraceae bacterium]